MKAIEIKATVEKRCIRVPDAIPDGTLLRALLLFDDEPVSVIDGGELKHALASLAEGLTQHDLGRPWDR